MKEIRIHARAGQGAITTAALLGFSYFNEGKYPYAFPNFGAARMGAPMNAFVRVDSDPVRLRSQIYEPDYVIVVDPTLLRGYNCFSGLKEDGVAIINGKRMAMMPPIKGNTFNMAPNTPSRIAYCTPSTSSAVEFNAATINASNKRPNIYC